MSLADLLTYCREHDIHGSYRTKQEGPERFRAYIRAGRVGTNGIDTTREKALDRMADAVLKELITPWKSSYARDMGGAWEGVYGRAKDAE